MAAARKSRSESLVLRYVILGAWALVCLVPILWFLSIGFRPRTEIITPRPIYLADLVARRLARDLGRLAGRRVPAQLGGGGGGQSSSSISCSPSPPPISLARYDYRGREDIGFYILSTRMMAPAIVAIPIFFLFKNLGLLDTVWALMLIYAAMNLSAS